MSDAVSEEDSKECHDDAERRVLLAARGHASSHLLLTLRPPGAVARPCFMAEEAGA